MADSTHTAASATAEARIDYAEDTEVARFCFMLDLLDLYRGMSAATKAEAVACLKGLNERGRAKASERAS